MRLQIIDKYTVEVLERLFRGSNCEENQLPIPGVGERCEAWLERVRADAAAGLSYVWLMESDGAAAAAVVGTVRIGAICHRTRSGQLSYWVAPRHRSRGHGAKGARMAAALAFLALGLKRLDTWIAMENIHSRRIAERLGFQPGREAAKANAALHYRLEASDFRSEEDAMLVIREEQLQAFRDEELRRLVRAKVDAVAGQYPAVIDRLTKPTAMEIALAAALRARNGYQFHGEYEIEAVVKLALCVGPYFDLWPKAHRILTSSQPPQRKFSALNEALSAHDWESAAAFSPIGGSAAPEELAKGAAAG